MSSQPSPSRSARDLLRVCDYVVLGEDAPFEVAFLGRSNIWIDSVDERQSVDLARAILCQALERTAPGQLSLIGYDSELSGLFAPFAELVSGEGRQLALLQTEDELKERLGYIRQDIQAVQNVIQSRASSLLEFRAANERPIESYRLVVLALDMGTIDPRLRSEIALLMKSGPAAGISFLIISTTLMSVTTGNGIEVELSVDDVVSNVTVLQTGPGWAGRAGRDKRQGSRFVPLKPQTVLDTALDFVQRARRAALPVVRFSELHDLDRFWGKSSDDGVTFSVGMYGINRIDVTIGDEVNQRHNALITGAVGQGKSNLISVIIHSLCMRYSPRELQLYLLDFKEGVTFKAFANIGREEYLPHAKTLGLESDVSFGLAVLESLFAEYERRMRILKAHDARSLRELRRDDPDIEMPRIVVVIDEFQMMFGDDLTTGQRIAELLEKSVRLMRAAGIHFILSSQTLSGNLVLAQKRDSIFNQVPIRIALKNSISESHQTLGLNNPAAAFLRPREAIVNLDYGEVSQNRKTVVAFADEDVLVPIRRRMWESARSYTRPPYVFESERIAHVASAGSAANARAAEHLAPAAFLGERISVDGDLVAIPFPNESGRNIALIGSPDAEVNHAVGMLQAAAVSLAAQHAPGTARFVLCDFVGKTPHKQAYPQFVAMMAALGHDVEEVAPAAFDDLVGDLSETGGSGKRVYVLGFGLDRWEYEKDPYGQTTPLKDLVETGPARGVHLLGWWTKSSAFTAQVAGFGSTDAFNTKLFLRVDERTVQSLTSPFVRWTSQSNRALVCDEVEFAEEMTFVPYAPVCESDVRALERS